MLARDQSRIPPGRSIRLTSSAVKGPYFARQTQKSSANLSSVSVSDCTRTIVITIRQSATQVLFMETLVCSLAQNNHSWILTWPIHRHPVRERGGFFACPDRAPHTIRPTSQLWHRGTIVWRAIQRHHDRRAPHLRT